MLEIFFDTLSNRKRSENDLSDITWSLCLASPSFKLIFLKFFFPENDFLDVTTFEREKSQGDSRPDFLIEDKGLIYLIECKINDRNHHFSQYISTFKIPKNRLGYITNYKLLELGFIVKTWEELYDHINNNLPEDKIERALISGYLKYLKNVCGIFKITKKMNLNGIYSLYSLLELFNKLLNRSESKFDLQFYSNKNIKPGIGISGSYFEINYSDTRIEKTWAWVGIYYERENPVICLGFENRQGWGRPVYEILYKHFEKINEDEFCKKPFKEDDVIWFDMTEKKHKEFNSSELNEQISIIKEFIDSVIMKPLKFI